jgi:hypothetical protein
MNDPARDAQDYRKVRSLGQEGHPMNRVKNMTLNMVNYISDNVTVLRCSGRLVLGEDDDALRQQRELLRDVEERMMYPSRDEVIAGQLAPRPGQQQRFRADAVRG